MSVGSQLRAAREQHGLSLEAVADRVKLRSSIVLAIEDNDFTACGGDVYARGHVHALASLLGLNPDELVAEMGSG
jgi:cytoskeleton protein RodZ